MMTAKSVGINSVKLAGDPGLFAVKLTSRSVCEGVEIVQLDLHAAEAAKPGKSELVFDTPCVDIYAPWAPLLSRHRALPPDWTAPYSGSAAKGAPVACLFSGSGMNWVTVALSDALRPARMRANISEETGFVECGAVIFENEVKDCRGIFGDHINFEPRIIPFIWTFLRRVWHCSAEVFRSNLRRGLCGGPRLPAHFEFSRSCPTNDQ